MLTHVRSWQPQNGAAYTKSRWVHKFKTQGSLWCILDGRKYQQAEQYLDHPNGHACLLPQIFSTHQALTAQPLTYLMRFGGALELQSKDLGAASARLMCNTHSMLCRCGKGI